MLLDCKGRRKRFIHAGLRRKKREIQLPSRGRRWYCRREEARTYPQLRAENGKKKGGEDIISISLPTRGRKTARGLKGKARGKVARCATSSASYRRSPKERREGDKINPFSLKKGRRHPPRGTERRKKRRNTLSPLINRTRATLHLHRKRGKGYGKKQVTVQIYKRRGG